MSNIYFGFGHEKIDFDSNIAGLTLLGNPEKKLTFYVYPGTWNFNFQTLLNNQPLATITERVNPSNPNVYYVYSNMNNQATSEIVVYTPDLYFWGDEYDFYLQSFTLYSLGLAYGSTYSCAILEMDKDNVSLSFNGINLPKNSAGSVMRSQPNHNINSKYLLYEYAPEDYCEAYSNIFFNPYPYQDSLLFPINEFRSISTPNFIKIPITLNNNQINMTVIGENDFLSATIVLYAYPKNTGDPVCTNNYDFGTLTKKTHDFLRLDELSGMIKISQETTLDKFIPEWLESLYSFGFSNFLRVADFVDYLLNYRDIYDFLFDRADIEYIINRGILKILDNTPKLNIPCGSGNCKPHYINFYLGGHPCPNNDCSNPCDDSLCCYDPVNGETKSNGDIQVIYKQQLQDIIIRIWGKPNPLNQISEFIDNTIQDIF